MSDRKKVLAIHPTARVRVGKMGATWIEDAQGRQLSIVCKWGSYKEREGDAWDSAARLCVATP